MIDIDLILEGMGRLPFVVFQNIHVTNLSKVTFLV